MKKNQKIVYLVFTASLFILIQCSSTKSNKTLALFFDGVTDTNSEVVKPATAKVIANIKIDSSTIAQSHESKFKLHAPYKNHQCEKCHDGNNIGNLVKEATELCLTCHESFDKKYSFIHGPVSAGYCLKCHSPHMSENNNLLIKVGEKLCYTCHNSELVLQNKNHKDVNVSNCTGCHNPHGGKDRYMSN